MKKSAIRILVTVIAIVVAMLSATCKPRHETATIVRFGTGGKAVDYAPYYVAKNKQWFADVFKGQDSSASYVEFDSAPTINESFGTNRIDLVFVAEPPVIIGRSAGIDIRIVGISCSLRQEVLVRGDSSIHSVADLKAKKIAVLKGSSSHYGVYQIIRAAGLQPTDITIVDMLPPDARAAFESGQVDAWAVWPPWVEQEEIAGTGRVLPGADVKIHSILSARGGFAQEHPELVRQAVAVLERAKKWIIANPDEAKRIVAQELGVPIEVVAKAWPRHDFQAQITSDVTSNIQAKSDFLYDNGLIKRKIDVKNGFIDLSFQSSPPASGAK
jgi:sulfonate transport system substrate-binding protein